MLWALLGGVSLLYFIGIISFTGLGSKFNLIWLIAGVFLILFGVLKQWGKLPAFSGLPRWCRVIVLMVVIVGTVIFVIVEGCIISGFFKKGPADLDYLIVLGAQMKASGPSRILKMRLDKAYDYLIENENTVVIVSGGQGSDEPVSEAEGMYQYLVVKGIAPERIIKEDQSKNTYQNMTFSREIIGDDSCTVGVISNNFHIFRATQIGKKAGFQHLYGIAAKSENLLQPANMLRECFGVLKDFAVGNM